MTSAKENLDKTTVGLTLASAALDSGERVSVILISEGVRLAVKGYAEVLHNGEPFKPLKQLLREVLEKGGTLHVSSACTQRRAIKPADLLPGAHLVGWPEAIRMLRQADRSLQL